ncbi:histidine--tRNA ligase [Sandarakinorhabdus sp. AAP62]|uniref:histidine--tRNA ligase n=1 Tax=Sandarakinorhabdus sp. AAP62 TaxID=1248916 RepID=UPI0004782B31|nr:histidine--tRNA ligase [Sandarakinorhabdus sp. AAP62]
MSKAPQNPPQKPRGTQDMIGEAAARFDHVIETFNRVRKLHGFGRVEVPVFESTAVFTRSLGETTDVVSKEMYEFTDRGGDAMCLRPEFTAGIARAYIENGWQQLAPLKLAAWGPLFRYERPQKGRFRQFHQLDAEILGAGEPAADVEVIALGQHLLEELGVADDVVVTINSMGDPETRAAWSAAVAAWFTRHRGDLSEDSQRRLDANPLRILDSKDAGDQALVADAPQIDDYFSVEAGQFFERLQAGLAASGIAWTRNARLVRGLDYYRHSVFEFITQSLGAQGTVLGGGRYDGLIGHMGGPETPAVGWAAGIERLAMLVAEPTLPKVQVAVVAVGPEAENGALALLQGLRLAGISAEQGWRGNLKKKMERAGKSGARLAVLIGADEVAAGNVTLRDLGSGEQVPVAMAEAVAAIRARLSGGGLKG